jgi:GNAT superfamily N-acetyltransferase
MSMTVVIRPAVAGEAAQLTALILRSKAYWGYDEDFMALAARKLVLTEDALLRMQTLVAEDVSGTVVGLAAVDHDAVPAMLDLLFVAPEAIGQGVGTVLLDAALRTAADRGFDGLTVVSDPHAESFYRTRGAVLVGAHFAAFTARELPVLRIAARAPAAVPSRAPAGARRRERSRLKTRAALRRTGVALAALTRGYTPKRATAGA